MGERKQTPDNFIEVQYLPPQLLCPGCGFQFIRGDVEGGKVITLRCPCDGTQQFMTPPTPCQNASVVFYAPLLTFQLYEATQEHAEQVLREFAETNNR
jgi:hypothetical protein